MTEIQIQIKMPAAAEAAQQEKLIEKHQDEALSIQIIDTAPTDRQSVAQDEEEKVQEEESNVCNKVHVNCGHKCYGAKGEQSCIPCLEPGCAEAAGDKDELCAICYTSELGSEEVVQLGCGHLYHASCVEQLLKHRWSTMQISFAFMTCP